MSWGKWGNPPEKIVKREGGVGGGGG